jgi:hypothetical protein
MSRQELVSLRQSREAAIARLSEAFSRDDLDMDEFERRVDLAHRAETVAELEPLLADLPAPTGTPEPATTALAPMVRREGIREKALLVSIMGGTERKGQWLVPRKIRIFTMMGGTDLDFRDAQFAPGVTEIHIFAMMGGVDIVVPPGLAVEMNGVAIMGGFEHMERASRHPDPDAPLLRIDGLVVMGGVDVDTRLPGESRREARKRERSERKALKDSSKNKQLGR